WRRAQGRGCAPTKMHALISPAISDDYLQTTGRQHIDVCGTRKRPLRILSIGRLEWKKGYDYALQAVGLISESGSHCEYRIVGDGHYAEAVAFARHQLGLESVVELLGMQGQAETLEQLKWA